MLVPSATPVPTATASPEPSVGPVSTPTAVPDSTTIWDQDIDRDTSWTVSNSPYLIPTQVTITPNATLQIEAGVVVLFTPSASALGSGVSLRVQGTLMAIGTSEAPIRFGLDPAITLDLSEPLGHHQGVFTSDGGTLTVNWCDYGGGNGIKLASLSGPVTVANCEIHDIPDSAISGGLGTDSEATIEDNFIHHAGTGVSLRAPGVIQRNCITNNRWGVVPGKNWGVTSTFKDNSISDSVDLEVMVEDSTTGPASTIDLSGNYWGGLAVSEIEFRTLDFDDDSDLSQVVFDPVRASDGACERWG